MRPSQLLPHTRMARKSKSPVHPLLAPSGRSPSSGNLGKGASEKAEDDRGEIGAGNSLFHSSRNLGYRFSFTPLGGSA